MKFFSATLLISTATLLTIGFFNNKMKPWVKSENNAKEVNKVSCEHYFEQKYSDSLNDHLEDYILISEKQGIEPATNFRALIQHRKKDRLVDVYDMAGYQIDTFKHSYTYLTPHANAFLRQVGKDFEKTMLKNDLKNIKLLITSMTRTKATVSHLLRINKAAVRKSPHLNGNSFDISYSRFVTQNILDSCDLTFVQQSISKILYDYRKKGKCWVTFERGQECLHVVVRK